MAGWQLTAEGGGPNAEFAVSKLLSRPTVPEDAEVYWQSFVDLDRDRRKHKIGGGMVGTADLPESIELDKIRAEGIRQQYDGESLEDFIAVLRGIDDEFVRVNALRTLAEFKASIARTQNSR